MISTIDESELAYHDREACGGSSEVYRAIWTSVDHGEIEVAAKKIKLHPGEKIEEQFELEVDILRKLQHKNIITYYGQIITSSYLVIVTEYAHKGSLYDFLRKVEHLPFKLVRKWALEAAYGIQYLKNEGVVHRDIKSPNFLITADDTLKVCDFGIAKHQLVTRTTQSRDRGTIQWLAPEVFMNGVLSAKADVFAFGIVLWELNTCEVPYKGRIHQNIMFQVAEGERPTIPDNVPTKMQKLMQRCWNQDRHQRPDIDEVVSFLENWEDSSEDMADIGTLTIDTQQVYTQYPTQDDNMAEPDLDVATGPGPVAEVATGPTPVEESVRMMEVDSSSTQFEVDGWQTLSGLNITSMQKREINSKILQASTEILCTHLHANKILLKLKAKGALSDGDVSDIRSHARTEEKVDRLLEILKRSHDRAYATFVEALLETDADLFGEVKKIESIVIREWRNTALLEDVRTKQRPSVREPDISRTPNRQYEDTTVISDQDFVDLITPLGPTDLGRLYIQLGLQQAMVEKAEQRANTSDVEMKAMAVLREWRRKLGSRATKELLLEALESLENREVLEGLQRKWGMEGV